MRPLILFFSLVVLSLTFYSCSKEFGETTVSYIRAEAVYKPVSAFRNNNFNEPARPVENKGKIYVGSDYLLVGENDEGIHVFDNRNPETPQKLSFINIPGNYDFFVEGDELYANSYFDLVKLDISDPSNVRLIARHESGLVEDESIKFNAGNAEEVLIGFKFEQVTEEVEHGTDIWDYLNHGESTIYFDYRNEVIPPSSVPSTFVGNSSGQSGTTNRLAVHDDRLYVLMRDKIDVFDAALQRNNSERISSFGALETLYEFNDKLYVGTETSMLVYEIFAGQLLSRGVFRHARACDPVLPVSENIAYVTTRSGGACPGDENKLYVVQTNTSSSQYNQIGEFQLTQPFGMALVDNKLFVAESQHGMTVLDATRADKLNIMGRWNDRTVEDVLAHPTKSDVLLISTGDRLIHLQVRDAVGSFRILSDISL